MSEPSKSCPNCKSAGIGGDVCPVCGHRFAPVERGPASAGPNRRWLWLWFWGVFIGTPVLALLSTQFQQGTAAIPIMLVGTLVSGFLLAVITKKSEGGLVGYAILYSGGLFIVYLGIAFVGCLVAMSSSSFR